VGFHVPFFVRREIEPGEVIRHENDPDRSIGKAEKGLLRFGEVHPLLGDDQPHGHDGEEDENEIVDAKGFFPVFKEKHSITLQIT
jgi:hypothetical protein